MGIVRSNRGLTLIEIVVSVAILMFLVLGVGAMLTTSLRADTYNQDRHIAGNLAAGLTEKIVDYASQGTTQFGNLIQNNFQGAMPGPQQAITGVRPAIAAEPANDRLYNDFDGNGVADFGMSSKSIFVYQLLIDDITVGGATGLLKRITVRIYYANQNSVQPAVDPVKHADPGGLLPRRFGSPLSEITTYIAQP